MSRSCVAESFLLDELQHPVHRQNASNCANSVPGLRFSIPNTLANISLSRHPNEPFAMPVNEQMRNACASRYLTV